MQLVVWLALLWRLIPADGEGPCAKPALGEVCGTAVESEGKKVSVYYGLPYAEPPVGKLRFIPPKLIGAWNSTLDATKKGPACLQYDLKEDETSGIWDAIMPTGEQSEDCLTLNIFSPKGAENAPVMVWVHGGSFTNGASTVAMYDGSVLAATTGSVVVTVNYRLGFLGFGYLAVDGMQGNMGLLDQQTAFRWVHEHISAFGGDPDKVTIFGESAGSASVSAHILAPSSQKYFKAAIVQSGVVLNLWAVQNQERRKERTIELANDLGCEGIEESMLECLQYLDGEELSRSNIFKDSPGHEFAAIVDNDTLFFGDTLENLLCNRDYSNGKSYLIGTTANEGTFMLDFYLGTEQPWDVDKDQYEKLAAESIGDELPPSLVSKLVKFYDNPQKYDSYTERFEYFCTDHTALYGSYELARELAKTSENVRLYLFNHTVAESPIYKPQHKATHTSEIPFIFGAPRVEDGYSEEDKNISRAMMLAWTSLTTDR